MHKCRKCGDLYNNKCLRCHRFEYGPKLKPVNRNYYFNTAFIGDNHLPVSDVRYHGSNYE